MSKLSDNIVKFRKQSDLSQEDLALKLGITRQSISKWERDEANPDLYNLKLLASEFQVTIDELIGTEIKDIQGKVNKTNFIDAHINRMINNAKNASEIKNVRDKVIKYSILALIFAIAIFIVGLIGFFKTGMINVNTPEFLKPTLSAGNIYPAIVVFRVIVVGITFFSIILTSKAINTLKAGLSIVYSVSDLSNEDDK